MTWLEISTGSFSFVHFYRRRVLRLYPALTVIFVDLLGVSGLFRNWSERAYLGKQAMARAFSG